MQTITVRNLRKNPYRGVISEMAREMDVTPTAIYNAIKRDKNLRIMELFATKIRAIDKRVEELNSVGVN